MAVVTDEVIHLIQCIPIDVTVNYVEECYDQLPVSRGNENLFMPPKTQILLEKRTQRICNNALPVQFKINGTWYKIVPKPVETLKPTVLNPDANASFEFRDAGNLPIAGIYCMKI